MVNYRSIRFYHHGFELLAVEWSRLTYLDWWLLDRMVMCMIGIMR